MLSKPNPDILCEEKNILIVSAKVTLRLKCLLFVLETVKKSVLSCKI